MSTDTAQLNGQDAAGVAGVAQRVVDAWARHDANAFAQVFTDDGTMVLPGDVYKKGRDEIRAFMAAGFQGPYQGSQVKGDPLSLRLIADGVGVMVTQGGVLQSGETAVAPEREIRATWVVVRDGGDWRVSAYHNSPVNIP